VTCIWEYIYNVLLTAQVSLLKKRLGSREVGVTDFNYRLRVIVYYNALIGLIEVARILHPARPNNLPLRPVFPMAFRLAIGESGRDLRRDNTLINEPKIVPMSKTDPNIQVLPRVVMRLVWNGMRRRVSRKAVSLMVGRGHPI
jgi:hypothetical protein